MPEDSSRPGEARALKRQPVADPMETIRTIKEIGPDRCSGSDFGQVLHMDAVDGMRVFLRALLGFGIKPEEVKLMLKDNPAKADVSG